MLNTLGQQQQQSVAAIGHANNNQQEATMSIYKKFIDSAKKQQQQRDYLVAMPRNQIAEQRTMLQAQQMPASLQKFAPNLAARSCAGPTIVGSTISSTPISKQQYKRLVESSCELANQPKAEMLAFSKQSQGRAATREARKPQGERRQQFIQMQHFHARNEDFERATCAHSIQQTCSPHSNRFKSSIQIDYVQPQRFQESSAPARHHWLKMVRDDPILRKWMQAMRYETELECLTALQARTLAIDEHSAGALSVRNSQVSIQEMRFESQLIIELIDHLIDMLPIGLESLERFSVEFSDLWARLTSQTSTTLNQNKSKQCRASDYMNAKQLHSNNQQQQQQRQLTIINCTPRKSALANARTLKPLDKLAIQIRNICFEFANMLQDYQERSAQSGRASGALATIDSEQLEASLRRVKEHYGKFVEISIRAECANIVRALEYDFSQSTLSRLSSSVSLKPVRPYEPSCAQLPLKWALIALWQLTKDDGFLCRTLTERWETAIGCASASHEQVTAATNDQAAENVRPRASKRLDYCTTDAALEGANNGERSQIATSLRTDYERLFEICQNDREFCQKQQQLGLKAASPQLKAHKTDDKVQCGALSSALKRQQTKSIRQISTIELLIEIIISQPNKHERLDVMNFIQNNHASKQQLIDLEELDQSVSAAIYTSNQYKVAALRILNHLCVNEQAIKTILKCFSTPPPPLSGQGTRNCENKIIKSIFECYQTVQEHIYQNETAFKHRRRNTHLMTPVGNRKRARQLRRTESGGSDEYSDYGSRHTNSGRSNSLAAGPECRDKILYQNYHSNDQGIASNSHEDEGDDDEGGDDAVVKEAIRLLIQLTNPFHSSNQGHDYYTLIGQYSVDSLVRYLTNIIKSTQNREMLLLSFSALANISFITTEPMKLHGTNRIVLEIFRASKSRSKDLELRDQAVTMMANAVEKNLMDIVSNGGLTFLLSCLEVCPTRMANYRSTQQRLGSSSSAGDANEHDSDYRSLHEYADIVGADTCSLASLQSKSSQQSRGYQAISEYKSRDRKPIVLVSGDDVGGLLEDVLDCACDHQQASHMMFPGASVSMCLSRLTVVELAALERIHQKTAVAFARITTDPITTRMVLKYGGVKQMIDLCKYDHKRNFSDTVLIACIAALRKISTVIGRDIFRNYNALDLVELDPRRSLKVYGNASSRELFVSEV